MTSLEKKLRALANGRDLPWRETRDPYAIWLSEIILLVVAVILKFVIQTGNL